MSRRNFLKSPISQKKGQNFTKIVQINPHLPPHPQFGVKYHWPGQLLNCHQWQLCLVCPHTAAFCTLNPKTIEEGGKRYPNSLVGFFLETVCHPVRGLNSFGLFEVSMYTKTTEGHTSFFLILVVNQLNYAYRFAS